MDSRVMPKSFVIQMDHGFVNSNVTRICAITGL